MREKVLIYKNNLVQYYEGIFANEINMEKYY